MQLSQYFFPLLPLCKDKLLTRHLKPMQDEVKANWEENALFCDFVTSPGLWVDSTLIIDKDDATSCNSTKTITTLLQSSFEVVYLVSGFCIRYCGMVDILVTVGLVCVVVCLYFIPLWSIIPESMVRLGTVKSLWKLVTFKWPPIKGLLTGFGTKGQRQLNSSFGNYEFSTKLM